MAAAAPASAGVRVEDLVPFLHKAGGLAEHPVGAVSAAPLGNAAVLPISWMYCRMMGAEGLTQATEVAILSANYISARRDHYPTLYASENGHVAHECILDLRLLKEASGVSAEDVAKRLMDYGFAPTLSFPGSWNADGGAHRERDAGGDRPLHRRDGGDPRGDPARRARRMAAGRQPAEERAAHRRRPDEGEWTHAYPREVAVLDERRHAKYWPPVGRVDNVYGDRNLFCSCVPMSAYE